MKIATIVGARPQFIKAAPLSRELRREHQEVIVHTGQHYDDCMSGVFFRELGLPEPDFNLGIGSGPHGRQTGSMLAAIEEVLEQERPDWVLVYGDTNSTLAGALTAAKTHIPLAHVESGVRSYNRMMPEEINRVLTDHVASLLLCPTPRSVKNLSEEGITEGVRLVGDIMYDAVRMFLPIAIDRSSILQELNLEPQGYALLTLHRAENVDSDDRLARLVTSLAHLDLPVQFPVHPRTKKRLDQLGLLECLPHQVNLLPPLGYLDMLLLQSRARLVLTDSGGLQREAYFLSVPCIILRTETEWPELVDIGASRLAGDNFELLSADLLSESWPAPCRLAYASGESSGRIAHELTVAQPASPSQFRSSVPVLTMDD